MAIYEGPEFSIHWKYAVIMNNVFVSFFYGPAMPILFPMALLSLVILYSCERLQVAYFYKKPPLYDQTINTYTINLLFTAPLLYSGMGAWVFSNQQVFRNTVVPLPVDYLYASSGHHIAQFFQQVTPGSIFAYQLILVLAMTLLYPLTARLWTRLYKTSLDKLEEIQDAGLEKFFRVLTLGQKKSWIREEILCRERLDLTKLRDQDLQTLMENQEEKTTKTE